MTTRVRIFAATAAVLALLAAGRFHAERPRSLADGHYLGYVRLVSAGTHTVGVTMAGPGARRSDGREVVLRAGGLASPLLLDERARPFEIVIRHDEVVGLASADDELPGAGRG